VGIGFKKVEIGFKKGEIDPSKRPKGGDAIFGPRDHFS
jgi:hypothetical protein